MDIGKGGEQRRNVSTVLDVTLRRVCPAPFCIKHETGEPYDCGEGAETFLSVLLADKLTLWEPPYLYPTLLTQTREPFVLEERENIILYLLLRCLSFYP